MLKIDLIESKLKNFRAFIANLNIDQDITPVLIKIDEMTSDVGRFMLGIREILWRQYKDDIDSALKEFAQANSLNLEKLKQEDIDKLKRYIEFFIAMI